MTKSIRFRRKSEHILNKICLYTELLNEEGTLIKYKNGKVRPHPALKKLNSSILNLERVNLWLADWSAECERRWRARQKSLKPEFRDPESKPGIKVKRVSNAHKYIK